MRLTDNIHELVTRDMGMCELAQSPAEQVRDLLQTSEPGRRNRRNTPSERVLALSRALANPSSTQSREIIRREIEASMPRLGTLAFMRREWKSGRPMALISAVLGSGLIKRANELVGQTLVDVRLLPVLKTAFETATNELRGAGIHVYVLKTSYDGADLGVIGALDAATLKQIHDVLEHYIRRTINGFHLALDIHLDELAWAVTIGAARVEGPTFFAMLVAHMRAGGAAKAARVKAGHAFHSVEDTIEVLRRYRTWVDANRDCKIAGSPAVEYDPVGGRLRINLDLIARDRACTLAPANSQRLSEVRSALNVMDWVHYQRSDRLLEGARDAMDALAWIDRLTDPRALTADEHDTLHKFMVRIHPRLAFARGVMRGGATVFVVDMKQLGPRGLSIRERMVSDLLEHETVTEHGLDDARIRQNDLIQELKQVLDTAVEVARVKVGSDAEIFCAKGGDDVVIAMRKHGAPLSHEERWSIAAALSSLPGVRVGAGEVSGEPSTLDTELGELERAVSGELKKLDRLERPGRFFFDRDRVVSVAV